MADDRRLKSASRPHRRYDRRLRDLVRRTGDLTIATDLGVPRSTARVWLAAASTVVDQCGRSEPHRGGVSAGDPEAATRRRENRGAVHTDILHPWARVVVFSAAVASADRPVPPVPV